ncbi:MAG: glutamate ligase domain-containing protein [Rhodococcus sp. (in: high G+C Gram-positive bacteria)]
MRRIRPVVRYAHTAREHTVRLRLFGPHQVSNALLALTMAATTGTSPDAAVHGLEQLSTILGRIERVDVGQRFHALVDDVHNEAGQRGVSTYLRTLTDRGRVICVLGATGLRDPGKRFPLGKTAAGLNDIVIVTDESPPPGRPTRDPRRRSRRCTRQGDRRTNRKRAIDLAANLLQHRLRRVRPQRSHTRLRSDLPTAAWQPELDSRYLRLRVKSPKRPTPLKNPQVRELSISAKLADAQTYPGKKVPLTSENTVQGHVMCAIRDSNPGPAVREITIQVDALASIIG